MQRFTLYDDFKDLYSKTIPPVGAFQKEIYRFDEDNKNMKAMIQ